MQTSTYIKHAICGASGVYDYIKVLSVYPWAGTHGDKYSNNCYVIKQSQPKATVLILYCWFLIITKAHEARISTPISTHSKKYHTFTQRRLPEKGTPPPTHTHTYTYVTSTLISNSTGKCMHNVLISSHSKSKQALFWPLKVTESKICCCSWTVIYDFLIYLWLIVILRLYNSSNLDFDLSTSLKAKFDSAFRLPEYFLLVFNCNMWPSGAPYEV